jgi:prephenate dehydratase
MNNLSLHVAIQGQEGSYHDRAARHYFGDDYRPLYLDTFAEVFDAVAEGRVDFSMSAVENSLAGSIQSVYDLLRSIDRVCITGEIYLRIRHTLLGLPNARLEDIAEVYSHPVALAQCTQFLKHKMPYATARAYADTAAAAAYVKARGDESVAAIASADNAERYGLKMLHDSIANNNQNYTRFLVLGRTDTDTPQRRQLADKTSLLIERLADVPDEIAPGILYNALGCFAQANIALTKIESRPIIARPWRYAFYVDCATGAEDAKMKSALKALDKIGAKWRELGTYKHGETI